MERKRKAFALLAAMLPWVHGAPVWAFVASSYVLDEEGRRIPSPPAYVVERIVDGSGGGSAPFDRPQGIFIDPEDNLFVADTFHGKVVKFNPSGELVLTISRGGEKPLSFPQGIFVDARGNIYVADSGNGRIVKLDPQGRFIREYAKPDSPFLQNLFYQPTEVVVDRREFMYVVNSNGDYRGILSIDREGKFRGFFAPNRLTFDLRRLLARFIATREQREKLKNELPPANTGLSIDEQGFIYTVTPGANANQLKKLNSLGFNVYPSGFYGETRGDDDRTSTPRFYTAAADSQGNVYAYDSTLGKIYVYDQAGNLLFVFGGKGDQRGLFRVVSGIRINGEGKVFVLDSAASRIQVFAPTRFADLVLKANTLYFEGRYREAEGPWQEVLKYSSNYLLAHSGLGRTYLKQDRPREALEEFRNADDRAGYSRAWAEYRYIYLRRNLGVAILLLLAVIAMVFGVSRFSRWIRKAPHGSAGAWVNTLRWTLGMIDRPRETFIEIKEKGSLLSLVPVLGVFYIVGNLRLQLTSFHFAATDPREVGLLLQGARLFIPWTSWCVACYAIATISEGKGFFKDVLLASAFCMVPYILFSLPLTLLSHVMTLDEKWFYDLLGYSISAWTLLLLLNQVMTIQDFSPRKASGIMVLSGLGIVLVWAGFALVYGLTDQVILFGQEIFTELALRR